jgi:hypothetical protein
MVRGLAVIVIRGEGRKEAAAQPRSLLLWLYATLVEQPYLTYNNLTDRKSEFYRNKPNKATFGVELAYGPYFWSFIVLQFGLIASGAPQGLLVESRNRKILDYQCISLLGYYIDLKLACCLQV